MTWSWQARTIPTNIPWNWIDSYAMISIISMNIWNSNNPRDLPGGDHHRKDLGDDFHARIHARMAPCANHHGYAWRSQSWDESFCTLCHHWQGWSTVLPPSVPIYGNSPALRGFHHWYYRGATTKTPQAKPQHPKFHPNPVQHLKPCWKWVRWPSKKNLSFHPPNSCWPPK